jgi:hypothetical protein
MSNTSRDAPDASGAYDRDVEIRLGEHASGKALVDT